MIQALLGEKIDQTQKFLENGKRVPVTEISVPDNVVLQVKTVEKDSYTAVQIGLGSKKKATKALAGHVKKAGIEKAPAAIKEVRVENVAPEELPQVGEFLTVATVFQPGAIVNVTGTSKGKGFAGVVKRHNFRGGPKTHGQSDRHRAPGSIGQTTTPGRVYKGKRMAGHMGVDTVTITNLRIVDVDEKNKKLYVLGLVPGSKNSIVLITKTGEDEKFVPLLKLEEPAANVAESAAEEAVVAAEAVETPSEMVDTASETVEAGAEAVKTPAEAASDAVEEETEGEATSTSNVAAADVADSEEEDVKEETK